MHNSPRRRVFTTLAAFGSLAFLANRAQAQTAPGGPPPGGPSPQDMARFTEKRIDHLIKSVDGTPDQKARLTQLAQTAMADMNPLREQHIAARMQGMALLAAPTIDRRALEQLRAQQMSLGDSLSKRMVQYMADAAEVLTPTQRSNVAERMQKRGEGGGWGRFGHGGHGGHGERGGFGGGFGF